MQRITLLPVFIYATVSNPYRIKVFVSFCQSRPMSRGLDIREPPRRSTTSSNPSPPLRNCVVGKRWSQATRGWPPAVQLVHAFQNAFCLKGARRPGGMHRSMAIGKNQVAALRFTKRSQFCMHSNKMPFRLRSASLAECPVATDADRISWRIRSMVYPTMVAQIRPLRRYGPSIGLWTD